MLTPLQRIEILRELLMHMEKPVVRGWKTRNLRTSVEMQGNTVCLYLDVECDVPGSVESRWYVTTYIDRKDLHAISVHQAYDMMRKRISDALDSLYFLWCRTAIDGESQW